MQSKATTVEQYLAELPADRRQALNAIRAVIQKNIDKQYEEGVQYGMIGWYVPHRVYPPGYHCDPKQPLPFVGMASQKHYMSVYMMCIYMEADLLKWFQTEWAKAGKKLDMGKCCVRFKKLEDFSLETLGKLIKRVPAKKFIAYYEASLAAPRPARPKKTAKKAAKSSASRKSSKK